MLLYGPDALPATQPIVLNQGKTDAIMLLATRTRDVKIKDRKIETRHKFEYSK